MLDLASLIVIMARKIPAATWAQDGWSLQSLGGFHPEQARCTWTMDIESVTAIIVQQVLEKPTKRWIQTNKSSIWIQLNSLSRIEHAHQISYVLYIRWLYMSIRKYVIMPYCVITSTPWLILTVCSLSKQAEPGTRLNPMFQNCWTYCNNSAAEPGSDRLILTLMQMGVCSKKFPALASRPVAFSLNSPSKSAEAAPSNLIAQLWSLEDRESTLHKQKELGAYRFL